LDKKEKKCPHEEGENMAVLAKPSNSMIKINPSRSKQFLEDSKKNVITPDFLRKCQQSARLLNKNK